MPTMKPSPVHEFERSEYDPQLCAECGNRERQDPHVADFAAYQSRQYRNGLGR